MSEFRGKTALVGGGSSGIGKAIAGALSRAGARVTVTGLPGPACEQAEADPDLKGIAVRPLDAGDAPAVEKLASQFESLDILVNCAGMIRRGEEFDLATFERVLDVNLTGTMRLCTAFRPLLARSHGAIVNTASMLSFFGGALVPAYSASKGGIAQLTKSLAIAWSPDGIRVNAVAPGWIATPLTQGLQDDPARSEAILARTPMRRWGRPDDVAGPVLFLCSEAAAFVTGAILPVDGGYSVA